MKWNIQKEDQLVELLQQRECCLMQDKPEQGQQGEGLSEIAAAMDVTGEWMG